MRAAALARTLKALLVDLLFCLLKVLPTDKEEK